MPGMAGDKEATMSTDCCFVKVEQCGHIRRGHFGPANASVTRWMEAVRWSSMQLVHVCPLQCSMGSQPSDARSRLAAMCTLAPQRLNTAQYCFFITTRIVCRNVSDGRTQTCGLVAPAMRHAQLQGECAHSARTEAHAQPLYKCGQGQGCGWLGAHCSDGTRYYILRSQAAAL